MHNSLDILLAHQTFTSWSLAERLFPERISIIEIPEGGRVFRRSKFGAERLSLTPLRKNVTHISSSFGDNQGRSGIERTLKLNEPNKSSSLLYLWTVGGIIGTDKNFVLAVGRECLVDNRSKSGIERAPGHSKRFQGSVSNLSRLQQWPVVLSYEFRTEFWLGLIFATVSLVSEVRKVGSSEPMTFATFQSFEVFLTFWRFFDFLT